MRLILAPNTWFLNILEFSILGELYQQNPTEEQGYSF